MLAVVDAAFAEREAFRFEPQLIVIGADPGLACPSGMAFWPPPMRPSA